eukprot:5152439-Lingulodinium_polyedra.AAC.1
MPWLPTVNDNTCTARAIEGRARAAGGGAANALAGVIVTATDSPLRSSASSEIPRGRQARHGPTRRRASL